MLNIDGRNAAAFPKVKFNGIQFMRNAFQIKKDHTRLARYEPVTIKNIVAHIAHSLHDTAGRRILQITDYFKFG